MSIRIEGLKGLLTCGAEFEHDASDYWDVQYFPAIYYDGDLLWENRDTGYYREDDAKDEAREYLVSKLRELLNPQN